MKKKESSSSQNDAAAVAAPSQGSKRKQYDLPGQIHDAPEENEPLRIFYESLYNQRPESEMAQIWMMEHGLLDEDEAKGVQLVKARRNRGASAVISQKTASTAAVKASPSSQKSKSQGGKRAKASAQEDLVPLGRSSSAKKPAKGSAKKKKKPMSDEDDDDDNDSDDDVPLTKMKKK